MKRMGLLETKEKDNNMTPIEQDDETWADLVDDKVVFEDSEDFQVDKVDLK